MTSYFKKFSVGGEDLDFYLGFEFQQDIDCSRIVMHSKSYVEDLVSKFHSQDAKAKHTPMEQGLKLPTQVHDHDLIDVRLYPYRQLIGSLQYLASNSRPDIAFATQSLSRGMARPSMLHWKAAKRIVAYLKTTSSFGPTFSRGANLDVSVLCDSDYASDPSRHSTFGYVTMIGENIVHWKSKLDKSKISLSTHAKNISVYMRSRAEGNDRREQGRHVSQSSPP